MPPGTIMQTAMPGVCPPPSIWRRWFDGLGPTGLGVVATAALIDALRQTVKWIVMNEGWIGEFLYAFGVDMFIGCAILMAVTWAISRVPSRGPRQYITVFAAVTGAAAAAVLVYMILEDLLLTEPGDPHMTIDEVVIVYGAAWLRYAMLGILIAGAWLYMRAESEHAAALEQVALDSARMDEQTAEARLQMLEAQIEPHFLFNTLAHVKWLYGTDRVAGARMLHNLKAYLAVALPQMRERESTLKREVAHVTAYLNIQQIRMGRRLAFSIDVQDALLDAFIPPLMLLTLAENSIKHGLGPLPEGGRIELHASMRGGNMRVTIADTGSGFTKSTGAGTGLANIRARLRAQFGDAARLSLTTNAPRGVSATVELPYMLRASPREI